MNLIDSPKMRGEVGIVLRGPDGVVKDSRTIRNLVVNVGLAHIISRMVGTTQGVMSHMAVGSGSTAAAAGDTALGSQIGSRIALDSTTISGSDNEKVIYVATFGAGVSTGAVTEAGIFNASTSGVMLCRTVFSVVNKAADDVMQITWTITLSAT
jgi:hypothetical protein